PKSLPIEKKLGVKFPRAPAPKNGFYSRHVYFQKARNRRKVRSQRDDGANIEIPVRPTVKPMANPPGKLVGVGGMAGRALNAGRLERCLLVKKARHAYHGSKL